MNLRRVVAFGLALSVSTATTWTSAPVAQADSNTISSLQVAQLSPAEAPALPGGDWPQFKHDAAHTGHNPDETTISATNAPNLGIAWAASQGFFGQASPVVANGVVYISSARYPSETTGDVYAYAAGCGSGGATCAPLWIGNAGVAANPSAVPAVANGVVFVSEDNGRVYAFDAAGIEGCAGTPKVCNPLWTAVAGTSGDFDASPTVAGGVLYVGSHDGKLSAFDAAGVQGCAGTPRVCSPLWSGSTGGAIGSVPAVADGVVYVGSRDRKLYAFDAAGITGCSGSTCQPLWSATTGNDILSSPSVAGGVVYVGSNDGKLYAFDAAGTLRCEGIPKSCSPIWTSTVDTTEGYSFVRSGPAVADGVVYFGAGFSNNLVGRLYAYAVGCGTGGATCQPLWSGKTHGAIISSPAVANGVVYVGGGVNSALDSSLYAFPVGCRTDGGTCDPLWAGSDLSAVDSSPAVANGTLYVATSLGLTAFQPGSSASGATYHALTPSRILDSRDGTGGINGPLGNHVAKSFAVAGVGGVPSNAVAVTGNLTVTGQSSNGYLFLGPTEMANPTSSTLNFPAGDDRANAVTVAVGSGGRLWVTFVAPRDGPTANVIFDVTGYFSSDPAGARHHALTPSRILDTRDGTGGINGALGNHVAKSFAVAGQLGVPANAAAVTGNLTVTGQTSNGYLFLGPNETSNPTSSTLNFPARDDRANAVTVALGSGGCLWVTFVAPRNGPTANVIFDVTGYFSSDPSGATYHALTPSRILDTRDGTGGIRGAIGNHVVGSFAVWGQGGVPANATAVTGNLTVTGQTSNGFLFLGPIMTPSPTSSTLNFPAGDDRANAVAVALGPDGKLWVTFVAPMNGPTTFVIFDVTGYFSAG